MTSETQSGNTDPGPKDPNRIYYEDKGMTWSVSLRERDFLQLVEDNKLDDMIAMVKRSDLGQHEGPDDKNPALIIDINCQGHGRLSALHIASQKGQSHTKIVDWLLDEFTEEKYGSNNVKGGKTDIFLEDGWGDTALHMSCQSGSTTIVERLLNLKADVNKQNKMGKTCLHVLASQNWPDVNALLLKQDDVDITKESCMGENVLMCAVQSVNVNLYSLIMANCEKLCGDLDLGAQVRLDRKQNVANPNRVTAAASSLIDEGDGDTILTIAVRSENYVVLRDLLIENTYFRDKMLDEEVINWENARGTSPLELAACQGNLETVRLIFRGADLLVAHATKRKKEESQSEDNDDQDHDDNEIDLESILDINAQDQKGNTALHLACAYGQTAIVKEILSRSSSLASIKNLEGHSNIDPVMPKLSDSESDPESDRSKASDVPIIRYPLDINLLNKEGFSPLYAAAKEGREQTVEALLDFAGIELDFKVKDKKGLNAQKRAAALGFDAISIMLKKYKPPKKK